jgi:AcrR family transcriptional regulator
MDDIARELGVSKKTLYQDFADKNDLISKVINLDINQGREFLDEMKLRNLNAIEEVFVVNSRLHQDRSRYNPTFYFDLKRYNPETYRKWLSEKRKQMFGLMLSNLKKGKREGVYRSEIHEEIIVKLNMARIEMLDGNDIIDSMQALSPEFLQEIFFYHLHGICNEKGLKILNEFKQKLNNKQVKEI